MSSSFTAKRKPLLDEAGFEQLLSAAYVLQQHNDSLRAQNPDLNPLTVLSQMAETSVVEPSRDRIAEESVPRAIWEKKAAIETEICRVCGRAFGLDEEFCGGCGLPRAAKAAREDLQSKWASLWYMQQAQDTLQVEEVPSERPAIARETASEASYRTFPPLPETPSAVRSGDSGLQIQSPSNSGLWKQEWSSAKLDGTARVPESKPLHLVFAKGIHEAAQSLLNRLRTHRRHSVIAFVSAALLFFALVAWGLWPAQSSGHQLSWFDSLLVELGLAEVPAQTPSYSGNPDVRVWVDVHTALYYCPGSALYGKTPGGHFSKQRAAQEDQFEPASRVACE